jgi:LysM domain
VPENNGIELPITTSELSPSMAIPAAPSDIGRSERDTPLSGPLLRRVHRKIPHGLWYALAAVGFAFLVVLAQLALYTRRSEPRDARAIVERELTSNTLAPGERVVRSVPVFRRAGTDYFRRTRGLLVLTDRRLIYLGAPPRDVTGASDAPPTFDQREYRIDTLVTLEPTFAFLDFARALEIEGPHEDVKLGIPSGSWPKAQLMLRAWEARHKKLHGLGVWAARVRAARADLHKQLEEYRTQPVYHVVRPGDAISSIASWYETSIDSIARLNGIVNNRIRIGQRLLIRNARGR